MEVSGKTNTTKRISKLSGSTLKSNVTLTEKAAELKRKSNGTAFSHSNTSINAEGNLTSQTDSFPKV